MSASGLPREGRTLSAMAVACAALVLVVVASSAWLRLAAPACPQGGCAGFAPADAVRLAHRVAAMGVTVLALVIAALAWKPPVRWGLRASTLVLIVLVAALAIVGRRSAGSAPPAVLVANLLGGLTLLSLAVGLAVATRAPPGRVCVLPMAGTALLVAAVATGGILATASPADPASLAFAHRALSWIALAAWGLLAVRAPSPRHSRTAARVAFVALAAEAALAVAAPGWPAARWLHNVLATAALCAAIAATLASRATTDRGRAVPGEALAGP